MGTSNDELTLEIIAAASGGISSNTDTKHLLTVAAEVLAECQRRIYMRLDFNFRLIIFSTKACIT